MKAAILLALLMLTALAAGVAACGGNDKPPLMPDGPDMTSSEAGAPAAPAK